MQDPDDQAAFRDGPEAFFAERGMADLPGDLIGSSFGHFSDTAPLEQSDAVAGIATRFGPVPFEESDLPDFDPTADDIDPFATLGSLGGADAVDELADDRFGELDDDPASGAGSDHTDSDDGADADGTDTDGDGADGDDQVAEEAAADGDAAGEGAAASADRAPDTAEDTSDASPSGPAGTGHDGSAGPELGDDGFGSGGTGPASILDDELADDPFYDEVTSEDALTLDRFASTDVTTYVPDEGAAGYEAPIDEATYQTFPEEDTSAFDDVDPGDLDLDDI